MIWFKLFAVVSGAAYAFCQILLDYIWHDKRTRLHKRARTIIQAVVCLSLLVTAWTVWRDDQSQAEMKHQMASLLKDLGQARQEAKDRDEALRKKNEELLAKSDTIIQKTETIADLRRELAQASRESRGQVTGGASFCYGNMSFAKGSDKTMLVLIHKGKYPLYNLQISMRDVERLEKLFALGNRATEQLKAELLKATDIGDLPANKVRLLGDLDLRGSDRKTYSVQIEARNGSFYQPIRLRKVDGEWKVATQVMIGNRKEPAYKRIDEGFPLNSRGEVDW